MLHHIRKIHCKIKNCKYVQHKTKKNVLIRFLFLLFVIILYFGFISYKYGLENGFLVTILTWSFFVLCTPIADAGFLIDFPIRLIISVKMLVSEIFVWIIAISVNFYAFFNKIEIYQTTPILDIFYHILINPIPFWSIISISFIGTFMSIYFGDELIDVAHHHQRKKFQKHKNKHQLILVIFIILFTIFLYYYLLRKLGINII